MKSKHCCIVFSWTAFFVVMKGTKNTNEEDVKAARLRTWYVSEKLEKSLLALINSFGSMLSRTFDSVQCCKAMFTLFSQIVSYLY